MPPSSTFLIGGYGPHFAGTARGFSSMERSATGVFGPPTLMADAPGPSWLVMSGDIVHAALEESGEIASYRISGDTATLLSRHRTAGGSPCHLALCGDNLVVACYGNGAIGIHRLTSAGAAGPLAQTIKARRPRLFRKRRPSHAHNVLALPDGRVLTLDLATDQIHVHRWVGGTLTRVGSVACAAGSGPRDIRLLPDGNLAVLGELSSEISIISEPGGHFELTAKIGLHAGGDKCSAAGLDLSPDGRFLYAGLRGPNRIAVIGYREGAIELIEVVSSEGDWPRHLLVDGDFLHVANQLSGGIASFGRGPSGRLTFIGSRAVDSPNQITLVGAL